MAHENVYGICENLCKVPVYAKSQIDNMLKSLITGTLVAGQTTLTISNSKIKSDSIIDVYYNVGSGVETEAVSYETIKVNNGSVVLTFEERETNLTVGIRVL